MKEALGKMKNTKEKNMCWQDGRLFDDKEDWIVDSCTKCTCQVVKCLTKKQTSFTFNMSDTDLFPIFLDFRSLRLFVTKSHVPLWPVQAPHSLTASAALCVYVSSLQPSI